MDKRSFWTSGRIRRLCIAIILAQSLAIPIGLFSDKKDKTAAIALGDFSAFYSAAKIVHAGMGNRLYDFDLQYKLQEEYIGGCILFPYPPYDAVFLSWLAPFKIMTAKWLFVAAMLLFLILSLVIGARYLPILRTDILATIAFFLSFYPVVVGVVGAQTAALSMFCYAGALWGLSQGTKRGEWLSGIFLGLWLFKPQYAIFIIPLFLLCRSWRILAGAGLIAGAFYLLGVGLCGWQWPVEWALKVRGFQEANALRDADKMISILGVLKACRPFFDIPRKDLVVTIMGYGIAGLIYLKLLIHALIIGRCKSPEEKNDRRWRLLELSAPAILLISPQPLFYDLGICVFSLGRYVSLDADRTITRFMLLCLFIATATALRNFFPIQPIFLVVMGIYLFLNRKVNFRDGI